MAYDYLGLVNRVLVSFNEVKLDSSTFASANGFHEDVKNSINMAIKDIYRAGDGEWPFAKATGTQVLTVPSILPYITTYTLPADCRIADWDSFYIKRTDTDPEDDFYTQSALDWMDVDQWRKERRDFDANLTTDSFGRPDSVIRLTDNSYTVSTVPDLAYTVAFDYFKKPVDLVDYDDVPEIPADYEQVIVDYALHYAYMFRDNPEEATVAQQALNRYKDGLHMMRRQLIPSIPYMRFSF